MRRPVPIKSIFFRLLAFGLLAVSVGFIVVSESNIYSADKTFVKSPAPASGNFAARLSSDDKEDADEDGWIDFQLSPDFSTDLISLILFADAANAAACPPTKITALRIYLVHRQLLI